MALRGATVAFFILLAVIFFASPALAFGAGNIPSLAAVEGKNFRHGDIEDILKKLLFIKGAKWTSKLVKRVYFGNWLRDYSQALDVGTIKSVPAGTIRILVWVLSFMSFGFATGEFEVTDERLGVYRPEEHIDNPKDYADNLDARLYDARLRPPVHPTELAIDPATCMKNYIANETLGIATSAGYIKHSLNRSIHFGRLYTSGPPGDLGKEEHLNEALRCLGQALHTLEDFSAHSNYIELVLREMGMLSVFPHVGALTEMVLHNGKRVFPLTTGTFGGVDFLHSVLGEAQDKFTQTELQEMDGVLAEAHSNKSKGPQSSILKEWLSKIPNCASLAAQADNLESASNAREMENLKLAQPHEYGSQGAKVAQGGFDPIKLSRDIYPILEFRDNAVKQIAAAIDSITEQIPGLPEFEELMDKISDQLSIYVFSVLSPYLRPIIAKAHLELKTGSTEVLAAAKNHQFEVWSNPYSTDPTHSMLSKDHFSNVLNAPAGMVATRIVEYVVPRVVFAWENVNADLGLLLNDIVSVLHHPGLRIPGNEIQQAMFDVVVKWAESFPGGRPALEALLNSESVKNHKNHVGGILGDCGHGKLRGGEWDRTEKSKKKSKEKKKEGKEDTIKIGGVRVPTGGLGSLGALGGIANAALAGYAGQSFPGEEKKEKKDKDKKDKEKSKDKEDKHKDDKYGSVREKEKKKKDKDYDDGKEKKDKKDKDRKDKDKDYKDKEKKKDKYRSAYSDDEDDDHHRSSSKYREESKSSKSKDHKEYKEYKDYKEHGKHHRGSVEYEYESRTSPHRHGSGGHHVEESYDYDYRPPVHYSPPPPHQHLTPYGVPSPYAPPDHHHHHSRSRSRSHSRSHSSSGPRTEYVEVEYAVPVPIPPPPPPPAETGYYYGEDEPNIVRARYSRTETSDSLDGGRGHRGYGEGWSGGYGKEYGY